MTALVSVERSSPSNRKIPVARKLATKKQKELLDVENEGRVTTTDIDPEFAALLLESRPDQQRLIRQPRVDEYARAMTEKRWRTCFDPIRLNTKDQVIDGQHRLMAIVQSGVTMKNVLIATLYQKDAIKSLDQGISRSLRDQLMAEGHDPMDPAILAGIVAEKANWTSVSGRYSREERMALYDACQYTRDLIALRAATKFKKDTWNAGPVSAAIYCMRKNRDAANEFFRSIFNGTSLVYGSIVEPSRSVFTYLVNREHRGRGGMKPVREAAFKCVRAYNIWRSGEPVTYLRYAENMVFPEVHE